MVKFWHQQFVIVPDCNSVFSHRKAPFTSPAMLPQVDSFWIFKFISIKLKTNFIILFICIKLKTYYRQFMNDFSGSHKAIWLDKISSIKPSLSKVTLFGKIIKLKCKKGHSWLMFSISFQSWNNFVITAQMLSNATDLTLSYQIDRRKIAFHIMGLIRVCGIQYARVYKERCLQKA